MTNQLSEETAALLEDSWRLTPARMAARLTKGHFKRYRHTQLLEYRIAQAIGRGGARLVVSMPPRHGKSWLASLFTPAWFLSLWPERNIILATGDTQLASFWGGKVRDFLKQYEEELGVQAFMTKMPSAPSACWTTAQGGGMTSVAFGSPIAGNGGHLIIVDDPIKSMKEVSSEKFLQNQIDWFNSTLYPHAEPNASIIVMMNRWHERDLVGYLKEEHADAWDFIDLPAIAGDDDALERLPGSVLCEERFDLQALDRIREHVGSSVWDALYQQEPRSTSSKILKPEWWRYYQSLPHQFDEVLQSWDMTFKGGETSDYVVGQVWGRSGENKFLIDQVRGKMDFSATVRAVQRLSEKYPQANKKLVEDKANGSAIISVLKNHIPGLISTQPEGGKQTRLQTVSAEIEFGRVHIPAPNLSPWVEEFINECSVFPNGKHDDQVDAMTYALNELNNQGRHEYARTQRSSRTDLSDSEYFAGDSARFVSL